MTKREAMHAGWEASNQVSVTGWGVFGFLLPIVGVPVACFRSPPVPTAVAVGYEDEATLEYFKTAFIERLKHRQVSAAVLGGLIGFGLTLLVLIAAAGAL